MRKIIALFFSMAVMVLYANNLTAQQKAAASITSVKKTDENIRFTFTSSKPLIFGDNRYVLYIGNKEFTKSEVPGDENNKTITFLLTQNEFSALNEGADIYVTYGHVNTEEQDMAAYAQKSHKCWALGKFSGSMLTK